MPAEEILEWGAYWEIKGEAERKGIEKARREAEHSGPRRGRRKR